MILRGYFPTLINPRFILISSTPQENQKKYIVSPEEILIAGDKVLAKTPKNCDVPDSSGDSGVILIKAAGRKDWYYSIRYDSSTRNKICLELQKWWRSEGRQIFVQEAAADFR